MRRMTKRMRSPAQAALLWTAQWGMQRFMVYHLRLFFLLLHCKIGFSMT